MNRASASISLLLAGSMMSAWAFEKDRRDRLLYPPNSSGGYPTTRYSTGASHGVYVGHGWYGGGGGYYGGRSGDFSSTGTHSGIARGGFGATGHAMEGHS